MTRIYRKTTEIQVLDKQALNHFAMKPAAAAAPALLQTLLQTCLSCLTKGGGHSLLWREETVLGLKVITTCNGVVLMSRRQSCQIGEPHFRTGIFGVCGSSRTHQDGSYCGYSGWTKRRKLNRDGVSC
ncbi:hypothetical protein JOB18_008435 [Solea senegalensis]|uniref:Uncharacterized protein n=1 Tax=Solea senegalensis TaxID=28829 RepID=A0AAV6QDX8_SOLSE|nr:hypothetical protein JOB18_008435 [Solea senegalensis]